MLIEFVTISGSRYEIDPAAKLARRVSGDADTESKNVPDKQWRQYYNDIDPKVGESVTFLWEGQDGRYRRTSAINLVSVMPHKCAELPDKVGYEHTQVVE